MIELKGHTGMVLAVAFTPDGDHLVSGSADRTARFWDLATGKSRRVGGERKDWVAAVACSRDGRFIAAGGHDRQLILWDVLGRKQHRKPQECWASIRALDFTSAKLDFTSVNPEEEPVLACGADNALAVFNIRSRGSCSRGPWNRLVFTVRFSPDGNLLAVGDDSESIKLLDSFDFSLDRELTHSDSFGCRSVAFSPDSKYLFAAPGRGVLRWDLSPKPGSNATEYIGHTDIVSSVSVSPDSRSLLSGSWDGTVRLWDVQAVKERAALNWNLGKIFDVTFAPDGMRAAAAGLKPTIIVWDVEA